MFHLFERLKKNRKKKEEPKEEKVQWTIAQANDEIQRHFAETEALFETKQEILRAFLNEVRPIYMKMPIDDNEIIALYFNEVEQYPMPQVPITDENRRYTFRLMTIIKRALQLSLFFRCKEIAETDGYFLGRTTDFYYYLLPFETEVDDDGYFEIKPQKVVKQWQEALGDTGVGIEYLFDHRERYLVNVYLHFIKPWMENTRPKQTYSWTIDDLLIDERGMMYEEREATQQWLDQGGANEIASSLKKARASFDATFDLLETLVERMQNERQYIMNERKETDWIDRAWVRLEGDYEFEDWRERFLDYRKEQMADAE